MPRGVAVSGPAPLPFSRRGDRAPRSEHEAAVLLEIAQTAGSTLDLNEVLDRVVERTASLTGADRCSIWLLDPSQERLLPAALYGMDPVFTARWKRRPLLLRDERLSQEVIARGQPAIVFDAETDPRTDKQAVALFRDRSILVVPLLTRGRVIGTLFLNHVGRPYSYTEQDVAITCAIASQAAVAIEHAQLFEETRRKNDELRAAFRRVGDALAAGMDLSETLQLIVDLATEMIHGTVGCLQLLDQFGQLRVKAACALTAAEATAEIAARWRPFSDEIMRSSRPVHLPDAHAADQAPALSPPVRYRSYVGAPLRLRGATIGTLVVWHPQPHRFSPEGVDLLASFANQAAVAIDNARLFSALQSRVTELSEALQENASLLDRLEREKEQLDAIFRNTSDAIYLVDNTLHIVAFNPAAERLLGVPSAKAIGASCSEVFLCGSQANGTECQHGCPARKVFEQRQAIPYVESAVEAATGRRIDVAASYSYIPSGPDGGFCVAIVRDISRFREVERLKSDFVSMVSHELRTPLAVIKGYAATLLNPTLQLGPERQTRYLCGINEASDRLTRLIDNILSVSRLESGRLRLNVQHVDLTDLIVRLVNIFQAQAPRHQIAFHPGEPLWLHADRDQVELVLANLVSNAVKYSPGGGTIVVEASSASTGVLVRVRDEGWGIRPDQLPHVFEKFYRGEAAKSGRLPGTGLGLYICRSIVELHGGQIWVESAPQRGSTFSLLLPWVPPASEPASFDHSEEPSSDDNLTDLCPVTDRPAESPAEAPAEAMEQAHDADARQVI
ncbi:MAG: GAF domain-containing protein [Chloroflexi bacterium]|nr:GAF domain-containing protein [Chloroflexota bacterium]